jgi:Zn-dependent protease with chaperone function
LAFLSVSLLLVPSYLAYEPRHTDERVSFKLALLAFFSATGIAVSIYRGIATHRATAKLTADWLRQGKPIEITGIDIKAYQIEHTFPLIAIVGFLRPKLFIARQVLDLLAPEEIAAALAHENGHLTARDNLKRGLLHACRDVLLIIPSGRSLDRAWSEASEEAADENAARQGNGAALDLASALVKIAKNIPPGMRPAMPAGVFLLGDEESKGVKSRVRRLIALSSTEYQTGARDDVFKKSCSQEFIFCLSRLFRRCADRPHSSNFLNGKHWLQPPGSSNHAGLSTLMHAACTWRLAVILCSLRSAHQ